MRKEIWQDIYWVWLGFDRHVLWYALFLSDFDNFSRRDDHFICADVVNKSVAGNNDDKSNEN